MAHTITDEQLGHLYRRCGEVTRRVDEGTISFEPTMQALQDVIEGKHEPPAAKASMQECGVFNSCRCTICGGFFADGDDICASGHQIGQLYPVRQ